MIPPAIAPRSGATQKTQSWLIAAPPTSTAGPNDRAGLTDVPVTGMKTIWMSVRVRPIASHATAGCAPLDVAPSTTRMKMYVATNSATNACPRENPHCTTFCPRLLAPVTAPVAI
jgi:hypothetical protein